MKALVKPEFQYIKHKILKSYTSAKLILLPTTKLKEGQFSQKVYSKVRTYFYFINLITPLFCPC